MALALDSLWFAVLILLLGIFSIASLISVRVFWALILLVIVVGLVLTIFSMVNKKRREKTQVVSDKTMLLEYLKSHGIGGDLSELAESLGIAEEKAFNLLLSLEEQGAIPAGSAEALIANTTADDAI